MLDTSCKRSVVGMPWLKAYMRELGKDIKKEMIDLVGSNEIFKLGDNGMLRSTGRFVLSINVAGRRWAIEPEVINACH